MPAKIGHDVLRYKGKNMVVSYGGLYNPEYREKVLRVLTDSERPLSITEVQKATGIKQWLTTKAILMEFIIAGKVECFKSGRCLLFRIRQEVPKKREYRIPRLPGQQAPT